MLDPWIIEQIRREEKERSIQQPVLELPLEHPRYPSEGKTDQPAEERGVVIIDL